MNVSENSINVDAVTLEHLLKITVSGGTVNQLSQYDSTGDNPHLSTGYVDAGGVFHKHAKNVGDVLDSTFTITVEIDWTEIGAGTHGWNAAHTQYTESGVTYSLSELVDATHGIVTQTALKVLVKPGASSSIKFFKTAAGSTNQDFGDLSSVTDIAQFAEEKVNNVNENANKGYLWFDTISLATLSTTTYASPVTVSTDSTLRYYVYGGTGVDGESGATVSSNPVNASIAVRLSK